MPLNKKQVIAILNKVKSEKLTTLVLEKCNLNNLMDQICDLTHLEVLDLQYTHLTTLPEAIKNLSNLVHLDLSKNQLTGLPDSIGQLSRLSYLNLSYNYPLKKLPTTIGNLLELKELYICSNTRLPSKIRNISSLQIQVKD